MKINVRRRRYLAAALALLCLSVLSYGTLAYFTAEDTAENVITSGNINIELIETNEDSSPFPEKGISGIIPGDSVGKIVSVINTGDNAVYVRLSLDISVFSAKAETLSAGVVEMDINSGAWEEKDGYYYYGEVLEPGEQTAPLFTEVTFAPEMGNEYMDAVTHIDVAAQAVQSRNNGTNVFEAAGWPAA